MQSARGLMDNIAHGWRAALMKGLIGWISLMNFARGEENL